MNSSDGCNSQKVRLFGIRSKQDLCQSDQSGFGRDRRLSASTCDGSDRRFFIQGSQQVNRADAIDRVIGITAINFLQLFDCQSDHVRASFARDFGAKIILEIVFTHLTQFGCYHFIFDGHHWKDVAKKKRCQRRNVPTAVERFANLLLSRSNFLRGCSVLFAMLRDLFRRCSGAQGDHSPLFINDIVDFVQVSRLAHRRLAN